MAIDWLLYSTRLKIDGDTFKDRQINSMVNAINGSFKNSPSYYEVSINGSSTLTGVQIVENSSNENSKIDYIRKIIMKPNDTIDVGDVVDWDSKKWLVITAEKFSDIYWYGMIQECNNTLKFYDNETTNLLAEVPCIFENKNASIDKGEYFNLSSGRYTVIISIGYISKTVDKNRRYLLNGSAYKTVDIIDSINGLIKIELQNDEIIPDDNVKIGCANYYSSISKYEVTILNGSEVTLDATQSSTLQLDIQCKLNDIVVSNPSVSYVSSDTACCIVSDIGLVTVMGTGSSTITVTYGTATDTIKVTALMSVPDNYQIEITPSDIEMFINRSKTFTANVLNNGIPNAFLGVTWNVSNVDGSSNEYCTYVVNGREITITSKNQINKSVKITAKLSTDLTVLCERIVTFMSFI